MDAINQLIDEGWILHIESKKDNQTGSHMHKGTAYHLDKPHSLFAERETFEELGDALIKHKDMLDDYINDTKKIIDITATVCLPIQKKEDKLHSVASNEVIKRLFAHPSIKDIGVHRVNVLKKEKKVYVSIHAKVEALDCIFESKQKPEVFAVRLVHELLSKGMGTVEKVALFDAD